MLIESDYKIKELLEKKNRIEDRIKSIDSRIFRIDLLLEVLQKIQNQLESTTDAARRSELIVSKCKIRKEIASMLDEETAEPLT